MNSAVTLYMSERWRREQYIFQNIGTAWDINPIVWNGIK